MDRLLPIPGSDHTVTPLPPDGDEASRTAVVGLQGWLTTVYGLGLAVWLFVLSGWLGVQPGRPTATRCDVYFQSDAGQRIVDAERGQSSFGAGSHAWVHLLWPKVFSAGVTALEPWLPREAAAVYHTRAGCAIVVGWGWATLLAALAGWAGLTPRQLALALGPLWLASGQVMVSLPDHFALSAGLLPACLATYLRRLDASLPGTFLRLAGWAILLAGVCITNALFPVLLAGFSLYRRVVCPRGVYVLIAGGLCLGVVGLFLVTPRLDEHGAATWQIRRWLNLRWQENPPEAAKRTARTVLDPVIAPPPRIDTNNFYEVPMLTFEARGVEYPLWGYDRLGTVAALAWLAWLGWSLLSLGSSAAGRVLVLPLGLWIAWNSLFHNLWGDEYFLYSPHYGWALGTFALLTPTRPISLRLKLTILVAWGQASALLTIQQLAATIP